MGLEKYCVQGQVPRNYEQCELELFTYTLISRGGWEAQIR